MSTNPQNVPARFRFRSIRGIAAHRSSRRQVTSVSLSPPGAHPAAPELSKVGLHDISLSYRTQSGERLLALDNINLQVRPESSSASSDPLVAASPPCCILIAGLQPQTSGQILVDGKPVEGPGTDRILIFQEHGLFPWLTVGQNVEFGMKMKGVSKAEREGKRLGITCVSCIWPSSRTATSINFPAACGSASPSPARWPPNPMFS